MKYQKTGILDFTLNIMPFMNDLWTRVCKVFYHCIKYTNRQDTNYNSESLLFIIYGRDEKNKDDDDETRTYIYEYNEFITREQEKLKKKIKRN